MFHTSTPHRSPDTRTPHQRAARALLRAPTLSPGSPCALSHGPCRVPVAKPTICTY